MFLGIAMFGAGSGSFVFAEISARPQAMPLDWFGAALVLVFVGMLMKAAMLPVRIDYQMHWRRRRRRYSAGPSVLLKSGPYGRLEAVQLFGGAVLLAAPRRNLRVRRPVLPKGGDRRRHRALCRRDGRAADLDQAPADLQHRLPFEVPFTRKSL